jgi:hypothetical protein
MKKNKDTKKAGWFKLMMLWFYQPVELIFIEMRWKKSPQLTKTTYQQEKFFNELNG